jgi:hypothetical protein
MTNEESVMAGLDPAISFHRPAIFPFVTPTKVGIQLRASEDNRSASPPSSWIPASAGMTMEGSALSNPISKIPFMHNRTFI